MKKEKCLSFDDITLIPQYSSLRSRKEADTSIDFLGLKLGTPFISSNMETITDSKMAITMWKNGGLGALHRFWTDDKNVEEFLKVKENNCECLVSVGVKYEESLRARKLYIAGARHFIIDVAHCHSIYGKEMIEYMKREFPEAKIIAGNVATEEAIVDLENWGADAIKVGISGGSVCSTRKITGHGIPAISGMLECSLVAKVPLIHDGGIRDSGDAAKILAVGADLMMCGSLFSATEETPGKIIINENGWFKEYKGSSSYERNKIAKEGVEALVKYKGSVVPILKNLTYGLQSAMSYSNSRTIKDFKLNAQWREQTFSSEMEGRPHIFNIGEIK